MAASDPSTNETRIESSTPRPSARWKRPLRLAAETDTDGAKVPDRTERVRTASQGMLLILTGVISAGSVLLAGNAIDSPAAVVIAVAIVWALGIISIASATAHYISDGGDPPSRRQTLVQVVRIVPVALLMVLSAIFTSQMVLLSIAEPNIDARVAENKTFQVRELAKVLPSTSPFAEQLAEIERELQEAARSADRAQAAEEQARINWSNEVTGAGGAGIPGEGPEAQSAREEYTRATVRVQQTQVALDAARDRALSDQATLDTAIAAEIADRTAEIADDDGLLTRLQALDEAVADSTTLNTVRWWLSATLSLVLLMPLFLSFTFRRRRPAAAAPPTDVVKERSDDGH